MVTLPVEDVRKLHAEVNQIVNQRYLLSTAAVTLFGIVLAWAIPKTELARPAALPEAVPAIATLLLVLLALLFLISHFLRQILRVYTTYLTITNASVWEHHWLAYRATGYFGYTKTQAVLFLALGLLAMGWPFAIAACFKYALVVSPAVRSLLGVGAIYSGMVLFLGFTNAFDNPTKVRARWLQVLAAQPLAPLQPVSAQPNPAALPAISSQPSAINPQSGV